MLIVVLNTARISRTAFLSYTVGITENLQFNTK